ncbi:MAG: ImmA/IrrE family metallo-endopeptidase [bacterium]|nr:ImmA/IrrE family metallo-endopeptidase [bacterium]
MKPPAERWFDPAKLLEDMAILHPEEIDVEAIAEFVGATVVYEDLRGCCGGLTARGDRAIITADRGVPRADQRMAVAHEIAHWLLDRGECGLVPSDPWGARVTWWDQDGEEDDDVTPEHRADEWAAELLLPGRMLELDLQLDTSVTFDTVRDLCCRFETPLLPTVQRLIWLCPEKSALVRSRQGEKSECLRRNDQLFENWLRKRPGEGTVAHELLHGSRQEAPGATLMGSDAWLEFEPAWWCTMSEDSLLMDDGEVLSLLWWPGDALEAMLLAGPDEDLLPPEPGREALRWLARSMGRDWGYYPVAWEDGELVMGTRESTVQRVVIPRVAEVDRAGIRELVAEVARQKEERADQVLFSMMD